MRRYYKKTIIYSEEKRNCFCCGAPKESMIRGNFEMTQEIINPDEIQDLKSGYGDF